MKTTKRYLSISLAFVIAVVLSQAVAERSYKRGVSQNNFTYPEEVAALTPGVCWHYNWGITPNNTVADVEGPGTDMEFVPMIWGGTFNEEGLRTYLTEHPGVKYLLGFNEPNFKAQANMTPQVAAEIWPKVEAIAKDFDLKLVGPALNYSPDAPYQNPTTWYDEFFELYPDARVDFLALHCYMLASDGMMNFINSIADRYGKQIWLTEFCAWDGLTREEADARKIQRDEMVRKVEALELSPNVYRYSWFMAKGADNYPYYSLLKYKNVNQGIEAGTLTDLGKIYVNMSVFDTTHYYKPDVVFAATNYVKSTLLSVNVSTDEASEFPLQVEGFSNMRTLEYLIDVPTAGEYRLYARVSTAGIPVTAYINGEAVGTATWETTGEQGVWDTRYINMTLPAGQHRLQLKGTKLSRYCDISTIVFRNTAGVENLDADRQELRVVKQAGNIYLQGCGNVVRYELYAADGALLTSGAGNVVEAGAYNAGFYIIRATNTDSKTYCCKIIL